MDAIRLIAIKSVVHSKYQYTGLRIITDGSRHNSPPPPGKINTRHLTNNPSIPSEWRNFIGSNNIQPVIKTDKKKLNFYNHRKLYKTINQLVLWEQHIPHVYAWRTLQMQWWLQKQINKYTSKYTKSFSSLTFQSTLCIKGN